MIPSRATLMLAVCILLVLVMPSMCEAAYRKPPFNGSIFGKRGNNNDYDSGGKASLSSMCEIVVEACQSWFPQDKK
ncbi:neuropeptide SIFamide [Bradysia coprophila]|uniref:neuropeptide SIFamide n=1 Tax=Bradysia coprophila TaxID=38358 RepID=UPI00187DC1FE|nr:neuropeptide SIFamide [Bradysia coprophila]XP_037043606.1 neuropeptide SIFamide [Bradysia coprophila]